MRGWRNAVFSQIYAAQKNIGNDLGNAIADHFTDCLRELIGNENVQPIIENEKEKKKHADILITLNRINLVIEVKADIGAFVDKSLADPIGLSKLWGRLYRAFEQCSFSSKKLQDTGKLNVSIVLIAGHVTAEHFSFENYAHDSGLFKELGIHATEIISWNELEHLLTTVSIDSLEEKLIEKWSKQNAWTIGSISSLNQELKTTALEPDYLKKADSMLWGNIFKERAVSP